MCHNIKKVKAEPLAKFNLNKNKMHPLIYLYTYLCHAYYVVIIFYILVINIFFMIYLLIITCLPGLHGP